MSDSSSSSSSPNDSSNEQAPVASSNVQVTTTPTASTSTATTSTPVPTVPATTATSTDASTASTGIREDMIKPAVSFLSSPNVRNADKAKKIAFLQNKGLNQAEIDEAFKRAGDSESTVISTPMTTTPSPTVHHVSGYCFSGNCIT